MNAQTVVNELQNDSRRQLNEGKQPDNKPDVTRLNTKSNIVSDSYSSVHESDDEGQDSAAAERKTTN